MSHHSMNHRGIVTVGNNSSPELVGKTVSKNCKKKKCPLWGAYTQTCDHLLLTGKRKPRDENGNCILKNRAQPVDLVTHKYSIARADGRKKEYDLEAFCRCYNANLSDADTAEAMGIPFLSAKYIRRRHGLPATHDSSKKVVPHDPVTPAILERRYWQIRRERRKK